MSNVETLTNVYRTHNCAELTAADDGKTVTLSGWAHIIRDHGQLIFIDLRDGHGLTQCVVDNSRDAFKIAAELHSEDVLKIEGRVVLRTPETVNPDLPTGEIEIQIDELTVLSKCDTLPFPVSSNVETSEELRLRYRYLDLRRKKLHDNIIMRSKMISAFREKLTARGFLEMQTPILTATSPEGARDFLVPSRLHPGQFFALPQSPQQFKQLLMVAGFERYFQIAPCFRDEAARADRSPGEHYQVDLEMSFVEQEDVFNLLEPLLFEVFSELGNKEVSPYPFRRIPYAEAMLSYGSDKPDLRNPLIIKDVSEIFTRDDVTFNAFKGAVAKGSVVRAIFAPDCADKPRSWFDKLNEWIRGEGAGGLAYIILGEDGAARGPIAKFFEDDAMAALKDMVEAQPNGVLFFVCDTPEAAPKLAGLARDRLGGDLELLKQGTFEFCWVMDFPMFEIEHETGKLDFAHNPFSMPQGGMEALETKDPLDILAYQYDIVCNGFELSSGAVRNHLPEIMLRAFDMVGYPREEVEDRFSGLLTALRYGAPPHAGCAPGVDRMVMLLCDEPNLREVIAFPMNQQQQDLLMHAPNTIEPERLRELHIRTVLPPKDEKKAVKKADDKGDEKGDEKA